MRLTPASSLPLIRSDDASRDVRAGTKPTQSRHTPALPGMQAVRVAVEESLVAVPPHAVVLYATTVQHFEDLTLLAQIAEVRTIDDDLISNLCLHDHSSRLVHSFSKPCAQRLIKVRPRNRNRASSITAHTVGSMRMVSSAS